MDNTNKKIRVALYIRVSTEEQKNHGYGVKMQIDALQDLVQQKSKYSDWISCNELVYVDEAYSGADLERPAFKKMMNDSKNNKFDVIAVWKIDRLSRNLSHLLQVFETLEKNKVSFFSLKESIDFSGPIGKLTFQIFGALAEFERDTIKMRTTEGILASLKSGNFVGHGIPYGYKKIKNENNKGSKLIIVKEDAAWVKNIFDMFVFDHKNYQEIAKELNKLRISKGESSASGDKHTKWYDTSIRDILSNPTYIGKRKDKINGVEYEIDCPRIIDDFIFLKAKYLIEEVSTTGGKKGGGYNKYLLSRKLIYKPTGRKFIGYTRSKDKKIAYRHKVDKDKPRTEDNVNIEFPAYFIETYVWEQIYLGLNKPKAFFDIYKKQNIQNKEYSSLCEKSDLLNGLIQKQEEKRLKIYEQSIDGEISDEAKIQLLKQVNDTIANAEYEVSNIEEEIKKIVNIDFAQKTLEKYSEDIGDKFENISDSEKMSFIDLFIDKIELDRKNNDGIVPLTIYYKFDPVYLEDKIKRLEPKNNENKTKKTEIINDDSLTGGC